MSENRCSLCPGKNKCVGPTGPTNSQHCFIGEAPGMDEDRKGEPFVGKTGREVNGHYLPLAGLRRESVRVTNTIRCLPDRPKHKLDLKKQLDLDLLHSCAESHLYPELECNHYTLLVPMGAFACHALDKNIDLELQHGLPLETDWGITFPMFHPAGGIHEPKKMLQIRTDWYRLRQLLGGTLPLPVDQYPNPDYSEIETEEQVDDYLYRASRLGKAMACDTEVTRTHSPYCISLSIQVGTGRVIRASNRPVLSRLQYWLDSWLGPVLFHNWLFDGEVVDEMGLRFPWDNVVDTMVKVFHLGNLPQGLKALSYRELGMVMQDFDDLVTPFSKPIVLDYYREAMCEEWQVPPEQLVRDAGGEWKLYKPQGFKTKLKRFWNDYAKNPEKEVFRQWTDNWEDHQEDIQSRIGMWPGKCISHVPWDKAIFYSCRDADATLRLWPVIQHMESRVGRTTQERWKDAA